MFSFLGQFDSEISLETFSYKVTLKHGWLQMILHTSDKNVTQSLHSVINGRGKDLFLEHILLYYLKS